MTTFTVDLSRRSKTYLRRLSKDFTPASLARKVKGFFDEQAPLAASFIVKNYLSGQRLGRVTGILAQSLTGRGGTEGGVPFMRVGVFRGPALRYAGVQEFGTVGKGGELPSIRPKKAKSLAVPQKPALTASGKPKWEGGPTNAPFELRFVPFRRGIAVGGLYDEREIEALERLGQEVDLEKAKMVYLLLRKVDIEPKHYLRDGMTAYLPRLGRALASFLRDLASERGARARARR